MGSLTFKLSAGGKDWALKPIACWGGGASYLARLLTLANWQAVSCIDAAMLHHHLSHLLGENRCQSGFPVRLLGEVAVAAVLMSTNVTLSQPAPVEPFAVSSEPHSGNSSADVGRMWMLGRSVGLQRRTDWLSCCCSAIQHQLLSLPKLETVWQFR